jgi:selenocysteine-specific elongation factor
MVPGAARWFAPAPLAALERRAAPLVAELARRDYLAGGAPKAELSRRLFGRRGAAIADFHFDWLARRRVLELDGERARPAGQRLELSAPESGLAAKLVELYDAAGLEPPSPVEAARRLAASPPMVEGLVRHLIGRGRLLKLAGGLVISAAAFDRLRAELAGTGWTRFPVGRFKERFGLSRKFAIPLLERLDGIGATRRDGDERVLIGAGRDDAANTP